MYYVYILKSIIANRFYTGHTEILEKRLAEHNSGKVRSTKAYAPWQIVYTEKYPTKSDAYKREIQIKSYKQGAAFIKLVGDKERWQSG